MQKMCVYGFNKTLIHSFKLSKNWARGGWWSHFRNPKTMAKGNDYSTWAPKGVLQLMQPLGQIKNR
jgi:hypothetical protein